MIRATTSIPTPMPIIAVDALERGLERVCPTAGRRTYSFGLDVEAAVDTGVAEEVAVAAPGYSVENLVTLAVVAAPRQLLSDEGPTV